jgi:hypothetical protein
MVSNHRLVLFTHALCRLSYPATLRTTASVLRPMWFAIARSARSDHRGHRHRPLRFALIGPPRVVLSHRNQSIRRLFRGNDHREVKANVGLSPKVFGTYHGEIPCARPCNAQRVRTVPDRRNFLTRLWTPWSASQGSGGLRGASVFRPPKGSIGATPIMGGRSITSHCG